MTQRRVLNTEERTIDTKSPWTVTQRCWDWSYGYTMAVPEWQTLLARAKRGDPEAEWGVADRYADGCKDKRGNITVRRSATKAAQWFRRAAEHGSSPAQNTLGVLLGNGHGTRKNVEEALSWLRKAFQSGNLCAAQNIAMTYRENGDSKAAIKWFRKAGEAGDGDALIQLGIHYYWGKGIRRNPRAAIQCFRRATRAKNISGVGRDDAFFFLGIAYQQGRGVRASTPTARQFFKRANIDGDHQAAGEMLRRLQRSPVSASRR
jgi:uncharacterized protein